MKPGLYNMPAPQYHADPCPTPSLNAGLISTLLDKSPAHAFAEHPRLDGSKIFKPSAAMDNGSLAHSLLFEGMSNMAVIEAEDWRTKAAQQARDAARADNKVPVLPKQVRTIEGLVSGAKRIWSRCSMLDTFQPDHGVGEQSLFWTETDEAGNEFWFRCRPDWLSNDRRVMIDGKFTDTSARPDHFAKQCMRMDYHTRAAFYIRGVKKLFGVDAAYFFLIAESSVPHEGCVIGLDENYLWLGEQRVEQAIALWKKCLTSKKWPGYGDDLHTIEPPAWAMSDEVMLEEEPELEMQA